MTHEDKRDREQSSSQTREKLLAAGLELLNRKGYRGATTREIALEAGVTEVTMYRHFRSKEQLFGIAIATRAELLLNIVPEPSGSIENDLIRLAEGFSKHVTSATSRLYRVSPELRDHPKLKEQVGAIIQQFRSRTLDLFHYYQARNELVNEEDDLIYYAFIGPIYCLLSNLEEVSDYQPDCERYVRRFLDGYRIKNGSKQVELIHSAI